MNNAAKIFLSHSSKDKDFVRRLANDLNSKNIPVWFDEWELKVGDSLNRKISDGIKESAWLAIILSNNSVTSQWVEKELNAALAQELEQKQIYVLPILIEDCSVPIFLKDKLFADFRSNYERGLTALLRRLIPEIPATNNNKRSTTSIQRQDSQPNPEDFLIRIVDVEINGRNSQYSGLFEVGFILNKSPDTYWIDLFENPTNYTLSLHKAFVLGNAIQWLASEADISNKKHWIYDWVEDANKRYLPIIQMQLTQKEQKFRESQLENAKIAQLETLLKEGRGGTLIFPTDEVMVGKCSLRLTDCAAPNIPGPITQINFANGGYIHVCFTCLQAQINENNWRLEG
jgi:hypothetical protein